MVEDKMRGKMKKMQIEIKLNQILACTLGNIDDVSNGVTKVQIKRFLEIINEKMTPYSVEIYCVFPRNNEKGLERYFCSEEQEYFFDESLLQENNIDFRNRLINSYIILLCNKLALYATYDNSNSIVFDSIAQFQRELKEEESVFYSLESIKLLRKDLIDILSEEYADYYVDFVVKNLDDRVEQMKMKRILKKDIDMDS